MKFIINKKNQILRKENKIIDIWLNINNKLNVSNNKLCTVILKNNR